MRIGLRQVGLTLASAMVLATITAFVWRNEKALVWLNEKQTLVTTVNAEEKAKRAERPIRLLVEAGPDRACETQSGFFKGHFWGRRTTFSDNRVEYSVRFSVAKFATVLSAESVSDFVGFAKHVEDNRKDIQAQKPAEEAWIKWQTKDVDGDEFQLSCSLADGVWIYDDVELHGLISVCEQALKDIEGIKANEARVPW